VSASPATPFKLPTIPRELRWSNQPLDWSIGPDGSLSIVAGEATDWFIDPNGEYVSATAPAALFSPSDDSFLLSARVNVDFLSTFDAGVLQVRTADDQWAKFCFEYSPDDQPMIVSVVTRGRSDDCNSVVIEGHEVYLRVAATPETIAFHFSLDGKLWHMVRYFALDRNGALHAGFSSQSPTGKRCAAVFSEINYVAGRLKDNRSGE
jgi:regulation of enolase protein 1 (concanavalin A-like superfamily)